MGWIVDEQKQVSVVFRAHTVVLGAAAAAAAITLGSFLLCERRAGQPTLVRLNWPSFHARSFGPTCIVSRAGRAKNFLGQRGLSLFAAAGAVEGRKRRGGDAEACVLLRASPREEARRSWPPTLAERAQCVKSKNTVMNLCELCE